MAKTHTPRLLIRASTWIRDSYGLYDYENNYSTIDKLHSTTEPCLVLRRNNSTHIHVEESTSAESLSMISLSEGKFMLTPLSAKSDESMWLVASTMPKQRYVLQEEDHFKLGRVEFRVLKIGRSELSEVVCRSDSCCRICLSPEEASDNLLVNPCGCTGSVGAIHIKCLKTWLLSKAVIYSYPYFKTMVWKSFACEICKQTYPDEIHERNNVFQVLPVDIPSHKCLLLEAFSDSRRMIYLIDPKDRKILEVGRNKENHVRVNDISVSRGHATLQFTNNGVVLKDRNSKFGTLVRVKQSLEVHRPVTVQVGRTVLNFAMSRPPRWYDCFLFCGRSQDSQIFPNSPRGKEYFNTHSE